MIRYRAEIRFTIDKGHPDYDKVPVWKRNKIFYHSDEYLFSELYYESEEDRIRHMKSDLRLIAGGGYDDKHIHNVKFDIERI